MSVNNPFDLTETAKKYNWDAQDMRIIIDVKKARGESDCYNQLYCWMRDHFTKVAKLNMLGDKNDEVQAFHDKFQKEFYECVRYEVVKN